MENVVESIFGLSPAQIQQRQNVGMMTAANNYAQLDPFQRAAGTMYSAGGMLAGGLAQANGMMTPEVQDSQMRTQALQGLDMSDPKAVYERAQQIQDPRLKFGLIKMAREIQAEQSKQAQEASKVRLDDAQAQKALRENPNLATATVGIKGKPGWEQLIIYDKTNPKAPYEEVGEPKATAAAVRAGDTVIHNPAPITSVKVTDPKDPSRVLEVDGRTYKGGSLGDVGVIGVSSKLGDLNKIDIKLQKDLPQAKLRTESMIQNFAKLDAALDALDKHKGLPQITGSVYGRTPNVSDKAIDADAQLNTIKSQIFQDALQAMREASKTGGAVGNVSDREGDKLERTFGALDRVQTTKQFKEQIKVVRNQVKQSMALIKAAFDDQFSGVEPYRGNTSNSSAPPAGFKVDQ